MKDTADSVGQKIQASVETGGTSPNHQPLHGKPNPSSPNKSTSLSPRLRMKLPEPLSIRNVNLTMEIAQLFMSMLHAWGLDPDLDRLCTNKLGLLKPKCPISFGLISRAGHMSLMLPGWHKRVCSQEVKVREKIGGPKPPTLMQQARSFSITDGDRLLTGGQVCNIFISPSRFRSLDAYGQRIVYLLGVYYISRHLASVCHLQLHNGHMGESFQD